MKFIKQNIQIICIYIIIIILIIIILLLNNFFIKLNNKIKNNKHINNQIEKFKAINNNNSNNNNSNNNNSNNNICRGYLSDLEYLEHMIPHHQVAIDISYLLQKKTKWPIMLDILRKIIWIQNYEIILMKEAYEKMPKNISNSLLKMKKKYITSISDFIKPNYLGFSDTYCDPHFFNPEEHLKHIKNMDLNDEMYIEHMIPHHQVAVDMSKKLLTNTKSDFMIYLAYRIIKSQQSEIIYLNDILKNLKSNNKYYFTSSIL